MHIIYNKCSTVLLFYTRNLSELLPIHNKCLRFTYLSIYHRHGNIASRKSRIRLRKYARTRKLRRRAASFDRNVSRRKRNEERWRKREKKNSFWNGRCLTGLRVELQSPRPGSDELRFWPVARESRRDRKRQGWIKKPHASISIIAIPVRCDVCENGYVRIMGIGECVRARVSTKLCARDSSKIISTRQVGRIHSRREKTRSNVRESLPLQCGE